MYQTCLFCTRSLGANDILETLPIGRRIAFDSAQGRLWVICRHCEKWNLVPFDTRLETIDSCERIFRATKTRFSTDNIGIARMREGLELVRIGPAERPEIAAWRYGDQFRRRRIKGIVIGGASIAAVGSVYAGGWVLGFPMALLGSQLFNAFNLYQGLVLNRRVIARVPLPEESDGLVTRNEMHGALVYDGVGSSIELSIPIRRRRSTRFGIIRTFPKEPVVFRGEEALDLLRRVLPLLNHGGGSRQVVGDAVALLDNTTAQLIQLGGKGYRSFQRKTASAPARQATALHSIRPAHRLAMEMLTHEEAEKQAMAGELHLLERHWREAEELAKISDTLALPESTEHDVEPPRPGEEA